MLYNPSRQDELEHSLISPEDKSKLYFSIASLNLTETSISLGADNSLLDSTLKEKVFTEIVSNRQKINPLKSIKEEKANSDILFANPEILTMNAENTKKLLSIKESHSTQEKISNFYVKNQLEQLPAFSEYLYYFSLINKNSTLNEVGATEEVEKSLKSLNSKISENKELLDNYFKLIPILEQFTDINLENLNIKLKFLRDIIPNIGPILESSDLIFIKMNETLHNVLKKIEKIILSLEEKMMKRLNISQEEDSASRFKKHLKAFIRADTSILYESDAELKGQILEVFNFIFAFSQCFKFSYGFFLLAKYIKKFNFEREFQASIDFSQLRSIGENDFSNGFYKEDWNPSTITIPGCVISYEYKNDPDKKKDEKIDPFAIFQYLPKVTSQCKFGNNWFLYNHINGLVRFHYKEEQNKIFLSERNTKAFDLQKGFILPIGNGDSGLICFVPHSFINDQTEAETEETDQKQQKQSVKVLFSDHISFNNKEVLDQYALQLNEVFVSIRDWLERTLSTSDEADEKNFVYTSKKIKIPNEHFEKTRKSEIAELMSKVVFHSNNNLIYCIRPILRIKKDKKINRTYFSESFIYAVDIFDLNLFESNEGAKTIQHIKSCVLTNRNEKYLHESEKSYYSHIETFLDHIPRSALKNLFVNVGKLFFFSSEKKVFAYDLIYDSFEISGGLPQSDDSEEYHSSFLTKGNCIAFLRVKKVESQKSYHFDTLETKIFETSLPINFSSHEEKLYYEISQMDSLNGDFGQENHKELNSLLDLNLKFKNSKKSDGKQDERDSKGDKTGSVITDNKVHSRNSLLYILGNLALGATSRFDNRNYLDIKNILSTNYFSYNDRKNMMILIELVVNQSHEVLSTQDDDECLEEKALIMFSLLNLLKLHVKNNSRLGWDFGIYFETQEKLQETFKNLFEILCKTIEKNFAFVSRKTAQTDLNTEVLEKIVFLLLEILFEALAFNFSDKNYFVNIFSELLIEIKINELKLTNADTGVKNENYDHNKFLFNSKLKLNILENIARLFNKNSNYVLAFLINEYAGNFILDMFKEHLEAIDKNILSKNSQCLINNNLLNYNSFVKLENENLKTELFYLNLEKILTEILSVIYVKYMNSILNFGKQPFSQNLKSILEEIFNGKRSEKDVVEIQNKLTNFVIVLSRKFLESGLLLADYLNSNDNIKIKIIKKNFVLLNINNILNFINLINFENFPDFVFGNWYLILNLLNKLSNFQLKSESKQNFSNKEKEKDVVSSSDKEYEELIEEKNRIRPFFKAKPKNTDKNLNKIRKKFDIVIDNFNIDDTKQKNDSSINVNLADLIFNKQDIEANNLQNDLRTDLYMYYMSYLPPGCSEDKKSSIEFSEKIKDGNKAIISYTIDRGHEMSKCLIRNIPINTNLIIQTKSLNYSETEAQNMQPILFKIRISNYKFFDQCISNQILSMNLFINKTVKFLSFYENANLLNNLNVNEEVKELISSSIFSGGIKDCKKIVAEDKKLNSINKDLEAFFFCLDDENKKKMEFLNDQLFENDAFSSLKSSESIESKDLNGFQNINSLQKGDFCSNLIENLKSNRISFENLISLKDMDFSDCENKPFKSINSEKRDLYIMKKLFILFDFLIEKVNREYIIKGPIIDKIILGLFFICLHQNNFINSLEKAIESVFLDDQCFEKFTAQKLMIEDCVKLMENKNFEEIFFIWKNCCQIRKSFKAKKDLIFQQQDENFRDEKIKLDFKDSEIEFAKINCTLDPNDMEDPEILKYFGRYLQKIKLIYYLKINNNKKNKSNSLHSFNLSRSQSTEIKEKIGFQKKNSLYLQNLMLKSLIGNNFEDKHEFHHKEKNKVKELANNLISAISNDKIDVDNILACLQSLNVKIKFREISLFIVNDVLKNFKNTEIKADLLSNFYQNFKSKASNNQLPNILDNLNTTSPEQSEIITNLFHEYIYNIIEELNSLFSRKINANNPSPDKSVIGVENLPDYYKENNSNSIFFMVTLLNNLIWNVKGRNFQFLLDIQFFQNLFNNQKNEILKVAKKGMFLDPRTLIYNESLSISSSINCFYDVFYISSFMTDIFTIYSNLIIKRIIKENLDKSQKQALQGANKPKGLGLSKSVSNLDQVNHNELIIHILDVYQQIIDEFLEGTFYLKKDDFNANIKANEIEAYQNNLKETHELNLFYLPENKLISLNNLFFSQRKIWNICINLLRLIIVQDASIDFIYRDISLFSKFSLFALFANEKNIYLVFSILKILVSHLNRNPEDFEYFGIKLKDLYKNYILPFKKIPTNPNPNSEDLLSIYKSDELEKMNAYEFFLKFVLTLKLNSSKLRVNKDLLYFDKKIFNKSNNLQNIIDSSIEDRISEFLRFFLTQSEFKENGVKMLASYALQNGIQVSKTLDSSIGYLNNFCKVICNTKIDFNNSKISKEFDSKDIENLVKKGTLIYDKSIYYLNQKASQDVKNTYEEIHENTTEDCLIKAFIEDSANILNQIETNKPNLLFPFDSEYMVNEEYLDMNTLIFADKVLIENLLKYLKENLVEKHCYSLSHLQSFVRTIKFLKKLTLISNENLTSLITNKNDDIDEEELREIEEAERMKKNAHLEELKKIIEAFFYENKDFFEHFLTVDREKLPANMLNINKLENIFFSYTPYDIKMMSKNKSENILNFEDPKIKNLNKPLFPLGQQSKKEGEGEQETNASESTNLKTKLIEEIKDLFLTINPDEKSIGFRLSRSTDSENLLNMELKFINYSYIYEQGDSKNDSYNAIRRLKKPKQIEIFDKTKAKEIMEELKSNSKSKPAKQKKKNYAVFLTDEFLKELNLADPDKVDVIEYLAKLTAANDGEETEEGQNNKNEENKEKVDNKEKKEEDKESIHSASRKHSNNSSSKSLIQIENNIEQEITTDAIIDNKDKETEIKEESKESNETAEAATASKETLEEVNTVKEPLTDQQRNQFIFEQYINNNYHLNKCVFFLNDQYFDNINKNFTCVSIDYSLLDEDLFEFLEKPSECSSKYQTDGKTTDASRRYTSIFYYFFTDLSRFFLANNDKLKEIKEEIKELDKIKKNKSNNSKENVESSNKDEGIFDNFMTLIGLSLKSTVELNDIKISDLRNFEGIYNQTEIIPFENQKEADIKNLGMHILKQYLRYLSLNYNKDYALWEEKSPKMIESEKYKNLLKYLKMLFYQTSYKDNYFNLKYENRSIISKLTMLVNNIVSSEDPTNIAILFNPRTEFHSLADTMDNELELVESHQYTFINEVFKCIRANVDNFNNVNTQNNLLALNTILLGYLQKEIKNGRHAKIINKLNLLNMYVEIIGTFVQKVENSPTEELKEFLSKLCLEYLEDKSLKTLMNVKSSKKTFTHKILDFTLNLIKLLFSCNQIINSNDLTYKIKSLNKFYIDLYESIDIIQNKFKSKILLDKIIKDTQEFQELVTKKFRMPNIKNSFCFTIRENKFKQYDIKFENYKENNKESIVVCDLNIKKAEEADGKSNTSNANSLSISYELNTCMGDSELYDNLSSTNISAMQKGQKQINKFLVYSDTTNNMVPKNYAIYKDSNSSDPPTIYNLPSNITNLYSFRDDKGLVMKQGNKYLTKGFVEKSYKSLAVNQAIEEIAKTETILKTFDGGIIITNKNIHVYHYINDYIESRFRINDNYKKFPLGPIKNPKNICWAHVEEYGIVLLDTDGQIYSAGKYYFGLGSSNTNFEYNNNIIHNTSFGKKKCRMAYVCNESSVYLIEEEDGKKYLYGSGYNCSNIGLESNSSSYVYTGVKNQALANVPLKKVLVSRCNVICISESNELYYCGFQRDYYFSDASREFYVPKLWEWPQKNNYTFLDAYKSTRDTFFVKLKNNDTGRADLFMFGQAFLFNNGTDKFVWYDKEPFKIDLNNMVLLNKKKIQEEKLKEEGKDDKEKKDNKDAENNENVQSADEDEKKKLIEINLNTESQERQVDSHANDTENSKKIEEAKVEQKKDKLEENIDEIEEEFIISRFELNKKPNEAESDEESDDKDQEDKNDSDFNNSCISEVEEKKNKSDKNSEFNGLTTDLIKQSYKLKEIKVIHNSENNFRIAALLGYEPIKRDFNLKLLENKYNSILNEQVIHKDDKKAYYNILNQKHAIYVIKNTNNLLKEFVFAELKSDYVYMYLSVLETSDSLLISPILFKSKSDLLEKTGFTNTQLLDEIETELNLIPVNSNCDKKDYVFENLNEFSFLRNVDLEPGCFEYLKNNFNEISNILFITDNLIINKTQLNENYFDADKQSKKNLIELNDSEKTSKHSIISIKCTDINIDKIYPYIYEKVKNQILDSYFKNMRSKILREFCDARVKFSMQSGEKKGKLSDFIIDLNKKTQKFLGVFDELKKVEFVEKVIQILEQSMIYLVDVFDAEMENQLSRLVLDNIFLMKSDYKEKMINEEIAKLSLSDYRKDIYVNRMSAKKFQNSRQVDKKFESTIFSQVYREMKKFSESDYFKTKNCLLFRVNLKGENATDAGGPAREIFTQIFEDLMSKRLDLFIPTPNQQAASGLGRDLWTINPEANTIYHLDCFEFIGKVFGYSIISKVYCPINLPNFIWKLILNYKLQAEDLEEIDVLAYNSIVKPCLNPNLYFEELNSLFDYATFTAALSNGEEVELCEGGKNMKVSQDNYEKFIELYLEVRFREVKEQANAINKGIRSILNLKILIYLSPEELSERVAGPLTFDIELFKENTYLSGYNQSDRVIGFFWKFIQNCTLEEKIQYLKFCWGRTTLPNSTANWDQKHTINNIGLSERSLPIAHTCFFSIDLPNYPSYEILKQKIQYAMNNSYIITDGYSLELDL